MNKKEVTLNDKGMLLIGGIILILTFALGSLYTSKREGEKTITFTREELERIVQLQELEDESGSGAAICAGRDKDGNLSITWSYDSRR